MTAAQTKAHAESAVEVFFMGAGEEGIIFVKSTPDADHDPLAIVKDFLIRFTGKITASPLHENGGSHPDAVLGCPKEDCIRQNGHRAFHLDENGTKYDDENSRWGSPDFGCSTANCVLVHNHRGAHADVDANEFNLDD